LFLSGGTAPTWRRQKTAGAKAFIIDTDLAEPAVAQAVVDPALAAFGRINALLNIAGAVPQIDLFERTDAQWEAGWRSSCTARRLTIAAWPALRTAKGAVVLMSGNSALFRKAPYAALGTINAAWSRWPRRSQIAASLTGCRSTASCPALCRANRSRMNSGSTSWPHAAAEKN
jgi:NAD(P)-dependent dehydrogenase (short-subunit alcohol dehydrogenase family)